MGVKTEFPRKWVGKKTTTEQEKEIEMVAIRMQAAQQRPIAWLEAKHEYFENLNKGASVNSEDVFDEKKDPGLKLDAKSIFSNPEIKKTLVEKKRKIMTVAETKLGITMVLTKEDCKTLGISGDTLTKVAIKNIRHSLGLEA